MNKQRAKNSDQSLFRVICLPLHVLKDENAEEEKQLFEVI
jgi:hypothetical protein